MKLLKKLMIRHVAVLLMVACGIVSDINWTDVPFWVYLILGGIYWYYRKRT